MTVDRIDPVLVEKAVKAFNAREGGLPTRSGLQYVQMEASIGVVLDELALKEEYEARKRPGRPWGPITKEEVPGPGDVRCRLTSEWRPVEQGDADGD